MGLMASSGALLNVRTQAECTYLGSLALGRGSLDNSSITRRHSNTRSADIKYQKRPQQYQASQQPHQSEQQETYLLPSIDSGPDESTLVDHVANQGYYTG